MFKEVVVLYRTSTKARQNKAKGDVSVTLHKAPPQLCPYLSFASTAA
jgi:hypothetical protein